jgi:UDP-N-acetylglucosamine--N-acetylmuramyl-(pentapeptide) pyrophosphoryl-undecaprenol N-acetylglucosamine transferase
MSGRRYILAGGGTSGHVNPALAIADQLKQDHPDTEIRFLGTARGIERDVVGRSGYPFEAIRARPLPYRLSPKLFRALFDYLAGRRQCRHLMQAFRPHAVIGTGGYVCSPVVAAAASLGIPVLLHEQNAYPGRSNRLMARRSQVVCTSFPGTEKWFAPGTRVVLTGNPVRAVFFRQTRAQARQALAIAPEQMLVLVLGGSLGARTINRAVLGLADVMRQPEDWPDGLPQIILAAGKRDYADVCAQAEGLTAWLTVRDYIHDIHVVMAAADLILCRSGANTCSELAALGLPSILVPYPHAAGDHQTYNARAFQDAGAALLCPDDQLTATYLAERLRELLADPSRRFAMGQAAATLARPDAAVDICRCLYEYEKPQA